MKRLIIILCLASMLPGCALTPQDQTDLRAARDICTRYAGLHHLVVLYIKGQQRALRTYCNDGTEVDFHYESPVQLAGASQ